MSVTKSVFNLDKRRKIWYHPFWKGVDVTLKIAGQVRKKAAQLLFDGSCSLPLIINKGILDGWTIARFGKKISPTDL